VNALLAYLDRRSETFNIGLSFALLLLIGVVDTVTPKPVGMSVFYLMPIAVATWYSGPGLGTLMAVLSSVTWFGSDVYSAGGYPNPAIPVWNATIRFGSYMAMALVLGALRRSLLHEKELARTDFLSGLANSRSFYEVCEAETQRSRRYDRPMTLVYIDVDDFKSVNDRFGHRGGDTCLRSIGDAIRATIRQTDFAARWGGDEFVVLLPETDAEQARVVVQKLQAHLLVRMAAESWPVTFSIGVGTVHRAHATVDDFVGRVDTLMYLVKRQGKNGVRYQAWDDPDAGERTA
jgi:diguanylate cyclase (GGDEF)-like protein